MQDSLDRLAAAMPNMNRPPLTVQEMYGNDYIDLWDERTGTRMWHLMGGFTRWACLGTNDLPKRKPD